MTDHEARVIELERRITALTILLESIVRRLDEAEKLARNQRTGAAT